MAQSASNDIVITGIGIFSPIGIGAEEFAAGLESGKPGFRRSELLDYVGSPDCVGGEIPGFTIAVARKSWLKPLRKSVKVMCREIQLGCASAIQAMEHAGLAIGSYDPDRVGVSFGANLMSSPPQVLAGGVGKSVKESGEFDFDRWGKDGMSGMEPLWLLCYLPNMPGCHIGIAMDARGPNNSITHDEASGGLAISEAANIIRRGRADVMMTGVTGTRLHNVKSCHATKWDILAEGPAETRCRPLDASRTGEVVAEAACTLILESRTHAEARGAKILGTLLSSASACVVSKDGVADERAAVETAGRAAMQRAGVTADQLGHVNVCASGHPQRDLYEAQAVRNILGDRADTIPVTAPKSYLGSAGSGSSLCEIAASLLSLQGGKVVRTLNCPNPDKAVPLNVVNEGDLTTDNRVFLKTSVTRMGQSSAIVIGA